VSQKSPGSHEVQPGDEGPVTVSISRRVRPGQEAAYETWVHGIIDAASGFPGHQGVNVLRPSGQTDGQYVLIYRYDTWANCENWEQSQTRAAWVAKLSDIVEGEAQTRRVTGLEFWFDLPQVPVSAKAPQYKMAIVLIGVVFALVYPLQISIGPLLGALPHPLQTLVIAVIQVLLMTYLVMPRVTQFLKGWLFR